MFFATHCNRQTLFDFLDTPGLTTEDAVGGLQEYVWRCMAQGKRVRDWCRDAAQAEQAYPSPATARALATPILTTLLPFNTHWLGSPALPPPLLPNSFLAALTRNQLIDALARLSREDRLASRRLQYERELVLELCLEYIGRRWRSSETLVGFADDVSRKLSEVEFEINIQGYPPIIHSIISPILHKIRFTLGFITLPQLVARVSSAGPSAYAYPPAQIFSAWVERRLQSGIHFHIILDDLDSAKSSLSEEDRRALVDALQGYALDKPFAERQRLPVEKQARTALTQKSKVACKWLSHKRANSSISRAPFSLDQRRPSLPAISPSQSHPRFAPSLTESQDICSVLGCTTTEVRSMLLGQLLELRYCVYGDNSWWFGNSKNQAEDILDSLESCLETQDLFITELRQTFNLSPVQATPKLVLTPRRLSSDMVHHSRDVSFDLEQYLRDISLPLHPHQGESVEDTVKDLCETRSTTPVSISSVWTLESPQDDKDTSGRVSSLSTYTIRHAVKTDLKTNAVELRFPLPIQSPASTTELDQLDKRRSKLATSSVPNFNDDSYTRLPAKNGLRKWKKTSKSSFQLSRGEDSGLRIDTSATLPAPLYPASSSPSAMTFSVDTFLSQTDSAPHTPVTRDSSEGQTRRQLHRQCVIFDGEPMSPTNSPDSWSSDIIRSPTLSSNLALPRLLPQGSPLNITEIVSESSEDEFVSPAVSPTPTYRDSLPYSPVPLLSILNLFRDISNGHLLSVKEVEYALMRFVNSERKALEDKDEEWDAEARCRVAWLIEQVAVLVSGCATHALLRLIKE
nr:hypothetical protein L203_05579 [Cryptococcus depauperatus CBS 7841]